MNLEAINENRFKKIIKDAVQDVLQTEMAKLRLLIASYLKKNKKK